MLENFILILKSIIIGIVEGFTEFLPISSTGHMILVGHFINFEGDFAKLLEVVIQLGAILAIIFLFRKKILNSFKSFSYGGAGLRLWIKLSLAFIPTSIVGILFYKNVQKYLMTPLFVSFALLIGGLLMIYAENKFSKKNKIQDIEQVSIKTAIIIGLFQCLSVVFPGLSRSASTIIGGWIMGLSSVAAAEFSFFLAIPTMIIGSIYVLLKSDFVFTFFNVIALAVSFIVAFIVALLVVDKFIKFLQQKTMKSFAIYRIIIGIVLLTLTFAGIIK